MQRVCDTWRSPQHSSATTAVNAFFVTNENHKTKTDDQLKEEAGELLEDYKFLFSSTDGREPKVSRRLVVSSSSAIN